MMTMNMSTKKRSALAALLALTVATTLGLQAGEKQDHEEGKTKASIHVENKVANVDLPSLARISFQQAVDAALAAVPGSIIAAELEVEHEGLMYSFEIVTADKKIKEVEIDAGNGKILDIEEE